MNRRQDRGKQAREQEMMKPLQTVRVYWEQFIMIPGVLTVVICEE